MLTKQLETVFRDTTIRPALVSIGLWSLAAEELLLGTAMQESRLTHRTQLGGGPALGLFQMEPATHDDIWTNFLKYRNALGKLITDLRTATPVDALGQLRQNDRYAAGMARVHYKRASGPLPAAGDTDAMAAYWKKYYNTPSGAGKQEHYVKLWTSVMG